VSADSKTAVIVSDTSIKNQVATLIAHIHIHDNPVIKTLHHAVNDMSTKTKLSATRCSINQATQLVNINCIIVITDSIHAAKQIFDSLVQPYQVQLSEIFRELREFFKRDQHNSIEFWDCPSCDKWTLHDMVDKEMKKFNLIPIFPCKSSWDFNRKKECNEIINNWKMMFQASDANGGFFLDLLDDDLKPIEPSRQLLGNLYPKCYMILRTFTTIQQHTWIASSPCCLESTDCCYFACDLLTIEIYPDLHQEPHLSVTHQDKFFLPSFMLTPKKETKKFITINKIIVVIIIIKNGKRAEGYIPTLIHQNQHCQNKKRMKRII